MRGNAQKQVFSYSELITNAKVERSLEYARLSSLNFEKLSNVTLQSISSISLNHPTSDIPTIIRIGNLVYTLIKLRQDHFPQLIAILNNLNTDKDEQVGTFISFVYCKVLKHAKRGFIQQKLDNCLKQQSSSNIYQTAYFLYFLAKHSPNSILLCTTQFINATTKVILYERTDVRQVGYETLKLYLQILERTQTSHSQHPTFPLYIFAQQNLKKKYHEQHGAFLIFAALLECSPSSVKDQASDLMNFFLDFLPKSPPDIRCLILKSLVLLAPFELESFKTQFFDIVLSALWSDTNQPKVNPIVSSSLLRLIQICPELFEQSEENLITTLRNLLVTCEDAPQPSAFSIIKEISTHFPLIIQSNSRSITSILLKTKICKQFAQVLPPLFVEYPFMWEQFRLEFIQIIRQTPNFIESVDVLDFISQCPSISSHDIISRLITALSVSDSKVRCCAPRAILAQISYSDDSFVVETIFRLITISLSDPDPKVREMILRSFNDQCYKFLTTDPILTCISSLVKDEVITVSTAAIELLGKISKLNPFDTLPTIRRLLLDALFMLDSPRPLRIKEEMTFSFLSVVNATEEILPIYCPTLCLIALRQLSFTPTSELTYFDQCYVNKINLNITKAIGIIAQRDVSLIGPHLTDFTNFFIWLLQQHGPKQLKIAIVNTLYLIISGSDTVSDIEIESMFTALINIASKWNSKKLNIAVLKLIGAIGAIDSFLNVQSQSSKSEDDLKPSSPSYSMAISCRTLLSVVSDDFLVIHHQKAIRSLVTIFCTDETATVNFFNEFMALFLEHIKKHKNAEYVALLGKVCSEAPSDWIMYYTNEIIDLLKQLWSTSLLPVTLDLIPILANVVTDRFSSFLPECATFLLDTLFTNRTSNVDICHKVIVALISLKNISSDYLFLIFPELVEVLTQSTTLPEVRLDSLIALRVLVQCVDCAVFSASIIRSVISCIQLDEQVLQHHSLMILYSIMVRLGGLFSFYAEQIVNLLQKKKLLTSHFVEIIQSKSTSFEDFPFIETDDPFTVTVHNRKLTDNNELKNENLSENLSSKKVVVDEDAIRSAFIFQEDETPWNWKEWYKTLVRTLLLNSPSPSLFSCSFLGDVLFNLAEILFNASFLSVWIHLSSDVQLLISASLTRALLSDPIPGAIRTSLVNLFDFMERSEHPIQISRQVLCQTCEKCSQYAKAFFFVCRWFDEDSQNVEALETLIRLSNFLELKKEIIGISSKLKQNNEVNFHHWSEQLGQWSTALEIYEKMEKSPRQLEKIIRCLKHLQRWDEIIDKTPDFLSLSPSEKRKVAPTFATAFFNRQQWSMLPNCLEYFVKESVQKMIITALYQISQDKRNEALQTVENGFKILAQNARSVFKHDNAALYTLLVKAQQLHEISEIAEHKENLKTWERRLHLCRQSFEVYHQILSVHLTVFPVEKMMKEALKMMKLALRSKDFQLFDSSLHFLFPNEEKWPVEVALLNAKGTWFRGDQSKALEQVKMIMKTHKNIENRLKSKIYYLCGQWIISMTPPVHYNNVLKNAVIFLEQSIKIGHNYFKAWHRWAWACSVIYNNDKKDLKSAYNALNGFLECVKLRNEMALSELLQMISLFFSADLTDEDFNKTAKRIFQLSDSVLLKIIPQLFTHLQDNNNIQNKFGRKRSSLFASSLAMKLLPEHYHVLIYPLLMRSNMDNVAAILASFEVENSMAAHQAKIISDGLLLCSSSLLEIYGEAIISTVRLLQNQMYKKGHERLSKALSIPPRKSDNPATIEIKNSLTQLLNLIQSVSELFNRLSKSSSKQSYSNTISIDSLDSFQFTSNDNISLSANLSEIKNLTELTNFVHISIIRNLMYLFQRIRTIVQSYHTLSMHAIAPTLAQLRNSILSVPGTYKISEPVVTIFQFDPSLDLFNSKQRPRLVKVYGDDGVQHRSLLKGCEDLRMDERVMQFFQLINQHIKNDFQKDYSEKMQITTYSITPLSTRAGLIQFVKCTDTLYSLISEYRSQHKKAVFIESDVMESFSIRAVDSLTTVQRLEVLKHADRETPGTDLRELIWLNTSSSRVWVERTLRFIESNALMSITGYVIGLGDRHPSNLMINRSTGGVVHIDFGDCFEIGKKRIKFPEKVPFRLTRHMIRAFGPTGVDGEFRITCEEMLKLVRSHKDSIMAVLDIFLQEPIETDEDEDIENNNEEQEANNDIHQNKISVENSENMENSAGNDDKNEIDNDGGENGNDDNNEFVEEENHVKTSSSFESTEEINDSETEISKKNETLSLNMNNNDDSCNDEEDADAARTIAEEDDMKPKKCTAIEEALQRIMQKITGHDFDNERELDVTEQVNILITNATDMYNLAHLYHGWTPLW